MYACPKCGSIELSVEAMVRLELCQAQMVDEETSVWGEPTSTEYTLYDDTILCFCRECDYEATLADFQKENEE